MSQPVDPCPYCGIEYPFMHRDSCPDKKPQTRPTQTRPAPAPLPLTDEQIKHIVNRFLRWKLPENFHPDAGISFKATFNGVQLCANA